MQTSSKPAETYSLSPFLRIEGWAIQVRVQHVRPQRLEIVIEQDQKTYRAKLDLDALSTMELTNYANEPYAIKHFTDHFARLENRTLEAIIIGSVDKSPRNEDKYRYCEPALIIIDNVSTKDAVERIGMVEVEREMIPALAKKRHMKFRLT